MWLCLAVAFPLLSLPAWGGASEENQREFFEKRIRPVLATHCISCHGPERQESSLRLDTRSSLLRGGRSGPVVMPGQPLQSRLYRAVSYRDPHLQMPPPGPLPASVIEDIRAWIEAGAPWPEPEPAPGAGTAAEGFDLAARKRRYPWIWEPPLSLPPPSTRDSRWPRDPVDRFLLYKLEQENLAPAPPADRRTWLRRVSFALTGLPPTPDEIQRFVNDRRPDAHSLVVDRLLASPRFGERWARHWMDLVHYAESRGHETDFLIANAFQYRDYLVRTFNADIPYPQLVAEHVAGDLLPAPRVDPTTGVNESVIATGWPFFGEEEDSPVDLRQDEIERLDNRIDVLSKTFLGLTVSCARCHDHKFDAISQRDYYALFGFLLSSSYRQVRFQSMEHNRQVALELEALAAEHRPRILRAVGLAQKPHLQQAAAYLMAVRKLVEAERETGCRFDDGGSLPESVAWPGRLDVNLLKHWATAVRNALEDPSDPLHPIARVVHDWDGRDPRGVSAVLKEVLDPWRKQLSLKKILRASGARIIQDYTGLDPGDWRVDGPGFGSGPRKAGQVRLGRRLTAPVARVFRHGGAHKDPVWDVLELAPGTERNPERLRNWVRAGRTLRTPTFSLETGKLYYLARGTVRVYATVDSYTLQEGPLYDELTRRWKDVPRLRWIEHDLTAHRGHRVHLEFSPEGSDDLAIAMVIEAPQRPPPYEPPKDLLIGRLADCRSWPDLARVYQELLLETSERMAAGAIGRSPEFARLADWLVQHPQISLGPRSEREKRFQELEPFFSSRRELLSRIQAASTTAPALLDGNGIDQPLLQRGEPHQPGSRVPRRFLEAVAGPEALASSGGSGRLHLAEVLTAPSNPLLDRVWVNRVWHHLFGRGIVASVDNFGWLGERPSHPELLDHLSHWFRVRARGSLKQLIRRIVLSQTYRMTSRASDRAAARIDPENRLLHRMNLRRLEAESIRDAVLAISGRLDLQMSGPPVPVHKGDVVLFRGAPKNLGPLDGNGRRSIYTAARRNFLSSLLLTFDTPKPFATVGRRDVSNVPAQSLALMNHPFFHEQARRWARRLEEAGGDVSPARRIRHMYLEAFGRPPTPAEIDACLRSLDRMSRLRTPSDNGLSGWESLSHALFNVKELIYIR
ncbi:MAG: PSD1 and planctomycete cytochrome C domain-containing protein [Acidobacteriota bacterium]|nr:PSD1 and planctomycete cytochrome C domain-containing protein [Acidobacteriota bacterium]